MKSYTKNLVSLKAFLGRKNTALLNLIKFCNLRETDEWSTWIDVYGNKLIINDKNDFLIKINPIADQQHVDSKDLYFKTHIKNIVKYSKLALIAINKDSYYIWLLDNNNRLRSYSYIDDIYIGIYPVLLSSPDTLKKIIRNLSVENFQEIFHIIEPTSKLEVDKAWITKLPIDEKLFTLLPEVIKKDLNFNAER